MLEKDALGIAATMKACGLDAAVYKDLQDDDSYYVGAYDPTWKQALSVHSLSDWEARARAVAQAGVLDGKAAFLCLLDELSLSDTLPSLLQIANDPLLDAPKEWGRRVMDWRSYCNYDQASFMALPLERRLAIVAMGKYQAGQEEWD